MAWRLFDQLNSRWRLFPGDFDKYSAALAFVTAAKYEARALFQGQDGNIARCLLADRVTRAYAGTAVLTESEEWFANGEPTLLDDGSYGFKSIPFAIGGQYVTVPLTSDESSNSVWSMARVLVQLHGPEHYIVEFGHRTKALLRILEKGADLVERSPGRQGWVFQSWPGWPTDSQLV